MASYGNPMTNGTVAQARKMYAEMGLCYECGRPLTVCRRELRTEYNRIYPLFEDAVSTLMSAVITVYGDPLEFADDWAADPEWVKSLDDMEMDLGESPTDTRSYMLP